MPNFNSQNEVFKIVTNGSIILQKEISLYSEPFVVSWNAQLSTILYKIYSNRKENIFVAEP